MSDFSLVVDSRDVVQAGKDLLKMGQDAESMAKSAQSSAGVFVSAFSAIDKQIESVNRANQQYKTTSQDMYNGILKVETATKSAQTSARAFEVELGKQERASQALVKASQQEASEKERLSIKYKEGYASASLYRKIQDEVTKAHKLGAISARQYEAELESLSQEYTAFQNNAVSGVNRFQQAQVAGTKSMSNMGVVLQQTGYQVGDFAVQLQSGQSAFVAFSQQATQLVGVLPLMSAQLGMSTMALTAISAGLGIGIPIATALAGVLWTVSSATKDAEEKATRFEDALKSARDEVVGMEEDLRLLQSGFENTFELTLSDNIKAAESALKDARQSLSDLLDTELTGNVALDRLSSAQVRKQQEKVALAEELVLKRQEELEAALQTADALDTLNNLHDQAAVFIEAQVEAQNEARAAAEEYLNTVEELEKELGEAEVTALALGGVDLSSNINEGTRAAARLAVQLGVALEVAQQVQLTQLSLANKNQVYSGRGSVGMPSEPDGTGQFNPSKDIVNQADVLLGLKDAPKASGGRKRSSRSSGSRGGAAERDDFVESLNKEMTQRRELLTLFGKERVLQGEINSIVKGLGKEKSKYSDEAIQNIAKENLALKQQEELYQQAYDNVQTISDTIENSMGDAFTSILDGTASVEDAFKNMAKSVIDQLLQIIIQQKIVGSMGVGGGSSSGLAGLLGGFLSFDGGGYTGNGSRSGGLDGKGGFMALVHPNETVIDHTKNQGVQQAPMSSTSNQKQQIELILHAPEGVSIETVRSEVSMQITNAGPKIVSQSVKASQNNLKNGSKSSWGL